MNNLPDALKAQVLNFVVILRQQHTQTAGNAWDVLKSLIGKVEAPANWSVEHDHYLYRSPKRQETDV